MNRLITILTFCLSCILFSKHTQIEPPKAPTTSVISINVAEASELPKRPCDLANELIRLYTDWDVELMGKILLKENSVCDPTFVGDRSLIFPDGIHGVSIGLLQIRMLPERRVTAEELKDPETNIKWAHDIWKEQGYNAWFNSYQKILNEKK